MKRIILFLGVFLVFSYCTVPKSKKSNINIQVKIGEKLNSAKFKQEGDFYIVDIDLCNNTDSVISFWSMSCSWEENWLSNNNALNLYNQGCDNNSPIIKQIEPDKKLTFKGVVHVYEDIKDIKRSEVKLGFILIKKNETSNGSDFRKILISKLKERKDIIWSEPFKIDK